MRKFKNLTFKNNELKQRYLAWVENDSRRRHWLLHKNYNEKHEIFSYEFRKPPMAPKSTDYMWSVFYYKYKE